jgi:hypothetical protein
VDPIDVKYLGLHWRGQFYVDTSIPFGYHHGTLAMQRVTDLLRYFLQKSGVFVLNYIDDLIGIAPSQVADSHFNITINLLNNLGFHISHTKTVPPTANPVCLGINFNISLGILEVPLAKLQNVIALCKKYIGH